MRICGNKVVLTRSELSPVCPRKPQWGIGMIQVRGYRMISRAG
jgi:hypothetical protein